MSRSGGGGFSKLNIGMEDGLYRSGQRDNKNPSLAIALHSSASRASATACRETPSFWSRSSSSRITESRVFNSNSAACAARLRAEPRCPPCGVLTVWRRKRSLREFASVRSQRVEVVTKGNRRDVCDVYLVPAAGADKRLDVERFETGKEGGCPEGIAAGRGRAQLTGLPFEDKT